MARELKDLTNRSFNPHLDEDIAFGSIKDPWPLMAKLRNEAPVSVGEYRTFFGAVPDPSLAHFKHYTVWRYDDVDTVLNNPAVFSSAIAHKIAVEPAFGHILVVIDPPEHTRLRLFLQQVFSLKRVKAWTDTVIRPTIHGLIDKFAADGHVDLVEKFTRQYPFDAVYSLLRLPNDDLALFHKLAVTQTFALTEYVEEAKEAGGNLAAYLRDLVDERRHSPGDDLVSLLGVTEINGERLDDEIVVGFLRHILNAAADTSYRTTGCLLVALLRDPALLAAIRQDRSLIPLAVEETLRWEGPVVSNFRTSTEEYVLSGIRMEAGAVIHAVHGSANRDETRFPDPDKFDIHRGRQYRHMGFGAGPHICLGMQLARAQIREAVTALLDRLPDLRLDPAEAPPEIKGFHFRRPHQLSVVFSQ